jgi:hypothetical protein
MLIVEQAMIEDLAKIADEMAELLPRFVDSKMFGLILSTEDASTFKVLVIDAKDLIEEELGVDNAYSLNLVHTVNSNIGGVTSGPSYKSVEEASKLVRAAVRSINRKRTPRPDLPSTDASYVAQERIFALQQCSQHRWDFARLVELCREINVAAANQCHMSTAMLLRTVINHVPPVLGCKTFTEVANNYAGPGSQKSFKASMQHLEKSLRNIADTHLHVQIREREVIPTAVQVNFAADLDVLLGEVLRVVSESPTKNS